MISDHFGFITKDYHESEKNFTFFIGHRQEWNCSRAHSIAGIEIDIKRIYIMQPSTFGELYSNDNYPTYTAQL